MTILHHTDEYNDSIISKINNSNKDECICELNAESNTTDKNITDINQEQISITIKNSKHNYVHGKTLKDPKWIVIHYTACVNVSAKSMCKSMSNNTGASSHFYVDENDIYSAVPLNYIAWHVGDGKCKQPDPNKKMSLNELSKYKCKDWRYDLAASNHLKWIQNLDDFLGNSQSIGVDICVKKKSNKTKKATDTDWYFEDDAVDNTAKLVAYIMKTYNIDIDHVIRHCDATGKLCLPIEKTEIMTPNGFVKLSDISIGDDVYQYNPITNSAEITKVLSKVEPYNATVCKNRNFEATLNHRMIVKSLRDVVHECQFSDLLGKRYYYISSCTNNNTDVNLTDDQIRLLVQIQGDGHFEYKYTDRKKQNKKLYYMSFHFKKERKILNLKQLLDRLNLHYTISNRRDGTVYFRIKIDDIKDLTDTWLDNKCFSNKFLNLSKRQFEIFLDELWKVDACVTTNKLLYVTAQKQNMDVVQILCALNNIRTHFYMQKNLYMLSIVNSRHSTSINNYSFTEEPVSCIEVPSSYIIIRQNGSTFITGNCPCPFVSIPGDDSGDAKWQEFKELVQHYCQYEQINLVYTD